MDVMRRVHLALVTAFACVLAAGIGLLAAGWSDDGSPPATADAWAGAQQPPDIPIRDFTLTDQDGEPVSLADSRGRVTVLTFLYSTCEDTCPLAAQQIRGALDILGHDVPALAISVDPANDTQRSARQFLLDQKLTRRMTFLLGDRAALEPIWKDYGIQPQGEGFEHTAHVVVLDRDGRRRIGFPVDQLTPEGLAHDIARLEAEPA